MSQHPESSRIIQLYCAVCPMVVSIACVTKSFRDISTVKYLHIIQLQPESSRIIQDNPESSKIILSSFTVRGGLIFKAHRLLHHSTSGLAPVVVSIACVTKSFCDIPSVKYPHIIQLQLECRRSNPSGKCSQERLTWGTVTSTMRKATNPPGCVRFSAGSSGGLHGLRHQELPRYLQREVPAHHSASARMIQINQE